VISEQEMKQRLRHGECTVTFTKVDGTTRVMRCSTSPAYLPVSEQVETPKQTKTTPGVIRAFDLDKEQWRSFRVSTVTEFK
jgi:hypothetical protein